MRADNSFPSRIFIFKGVEGSMTAAATSGPASAPRPASSMPQILRDLAALIVI